MNPSNGAWKTIAITLLGMVATGVSAWLVLGRDNVNRLEFTELRIEFTRSIDKLDDTVHDLSEAVVRLNTILEERDETR